ncbi:unnamed protein product, partial [Linum tenue]
MTPHFEAVLALYFSSVLLEPVPSEITRNRPYSIGFIEHPPGFFMICLVTSFMA